MTSLVLASAMLLAAGTAVVDEVENPSHAGLADIGEASDVETAAPLDAPAPVLLPRELTRLELTKPFASAPAPGRTRIETTEAAGGELVTLLQSGENGTEVPVLSFFRDTMGDADPANDRLRYVWVLSQKSASPARHLLAALPFFYSRTHSRPPAAGTLPRPMIDLTKPTGGTVRSAARTWSQWQFLDSMGTAVRATTRSYRNNYRERSAIRVAQASAAIEAHLSSAPASRDLAQVRARLMLSTQMMGGLVTEQNLPMIHEKDITRREETRGHNWELLRDQAELNGLYFQPLRLSGGPASHGMLWVSKEDLPRQVYRKFDNRFLRVSNPWKDRELRRWRGYTENWTLNGKLTEMIPLALYGFDHPKTPHLLVSMRDQRGPRRSEMIRRGTSDSLSGVIGFSQFSSWQYFAGTMAWNIVSNRRGAPNNRALRARSYGEFKYRLAHDTTLNPRLRAELMRQSNLLSMNPLDEDSRVETRTAEIQYRALLQWVAAPDGLALTIEKDRREELAMLRRSAGRRTLTIAARWLTLGLYRPQSEPGENALAELSDRRRELSRLAAVRKAPVQEPGVATGGGN